jgi:transcriptional regulator GlxA family with amidase domain
VIGLTPGANVRQAGADYTHVADGRVREALEFLAAHLAERIDLRRLARHVGLSPAHLSRLFKADGRGTAARRPETNALADGAGSSLHHAAAR